MSARGEMSSTLTFALTEQTGDLSFAFKTILAYNRSAGLIGLKQTG
jgi:hypothetical protein